MAQRVAGRPGNEIPLAAGDAHVADADEILGSLYAFGDQRGVADFCQILHGAHEMELDPIVGNAIDEVLVDLDELRPQFGPHAQVGKAFAEIVDGYLETASTIMQQGFDNARHVRDLLVFGQFEHDAIRRNAEFAEQIPGMAIHQAGIEQATWRDVEEYPPGQTPRSEGPQTRRPAGSFQIERQPVTGSRAK